MACDPLMTVPGVEEKKAQLEKELEGLYYLDEERSVACLQRGRRDWWYIYRRLIWVRKFNTQTALAWRRMYLEYRAHVLLPHNPFTCAVSQQGQTAEPLQLAQYSHRATQLSLYTQNLILQIAVGWANLSCILRMGILGYLHSLRFSGSVVSGA